MSWALSLPPQLTIKASIAQARVPACPKESASGLALTLQNGELSGHLDYLELDLTCKRPVSTTSSNPTEVAEIISVLNELPELDFKIKQLVVHLPEAKVTGPGELAHTKTGYQLSWHTNFGAAELELQPEGQGLRWQGVVPGSLLTKQLNGRVTLSGQWLPEEPVELSVKGQLPKPLQGNWQLALSALETPHGWQLAPTSRLTVPRLRWQDVEFNQLVLKPTQALSLAKPWHAELSWQQGRWQQQPIPKGTLSANSVNNNSLAGAMALQLAPQVALKGSWRYGEGLALQLPRQTFNAPEVWRWLNTWLTLPVGIAAEQGKLAVSLNANNILDNRQPIFLDAQLSDSHWRYLDIEAQQLAARLQMQWDHRGLRSLGPQPISLQHLALGVPITDIVGALRWQADGIWLSGLTAHAFDGQLALSPMALGAPLHSELQLSNISLDQLLSYASVEGLTGSGRLYGRLPISLEQGISVTDGSAYSDNGWISYQADEELTAAGADNISLELALGLLQDLRYERLTAAITMKPNGEATIDSHFKGQAPVKGKLHDVNFNYHHQENLLQLLASLRYAQGLTERLPTRSKGEKK